MGWSEVMRDLECVQQFIHIPAFFARRGRLPLFLCCDLDHRYFTSYQHSSRSKRLAIVENLLKATLYIPSLLPRPPDPDT